MAKSLTKQLKKPDEFVSFWTRLGKALGQHRKLSIGFVVALAVAIGGAWAYVAHRYAREEKATAAFGRIDRIASAELLPEKADSKAVTAETDEDEDAVPRFKTEKERLEAANREADAFVAKYGRTGLGRRALLGKASRLIALGQPGEAATIYQTLAASETDPALRAIEQDGAGAASEALGKPGDALRDYTTIAQGSASDDNFYLDRAMYAKARVLEEQGKRKEAEQTLRDILSKVPQTPLRQQIDDRLAVLTEK